MTSTDQLRKQIVNSRELLQQLTGIRNEAYNKCYFDIAIEWAEMHCLDEDAALYIASQHEFWGWWAINWAEKTDVFIDCIHYRSELGEWHLMVTENNMWWWVTETHEIENAFSVFMKKTMLQCQSNRVVLEKSFHKMLKKV